MLPQPFDLVQLDPEALTDPAGLHRGLWGSPGISQSPSPGSLQGRKPLESRLPLLLPSAPQLAPAGPVALAERGRGRHLHPPGPRSPPAPPHPRAPEGLGSGAGAGVRLRTRGPGEAGAGRGEALPSFARGDTDAGGSEAAEAVSLPVDRARLQWPGLRAAGSGQGRAGRRPGSIWVAGRRGRGGSCAEAPGTGGPWGREPRSPRRGGGRSPCSLPPAPRLGRSRRGPGGKATPQKPPERRRLQLRGADALRAAGGARGPRPPRLGCSWERVFWGSASWGSRTRQGCQRDSGLRGSRVRVFFQDTPLYF